MDETKTYKINSAKREEIDGLIRAAIKKAATEQKWEHLPAVEASLDRRYTEKVAQKKGDAAWNPYERYLLSNGFTVYVSIKTMTATVSEKPKPQAVRKVEATRRRKAERAARKARRESKAAGKAFNTKTPKPDQKKVNVVKYDPTLSTLDSEGTTTAPKPKSK